MGRNAIRVYFYYTSILGPHQLNNKKGVSILFSILCIFNSHYSTVTDKWHDTHRAFKLARPRNEPLESDVRRLSRRSNIERRHWFRNMWGGSDLMLLLLRSLQTQWTSSILQGLILIEISRYALYPIQFVISNLWVNWNMITYPNSFCWIGNFVVNSSLVDRVKRAIL